MFSVMSNLQIHYHFKLQIHINKETCTTTIAEVDVTQCYPLSLNECMDDSGRIVRKTPFAVSSIIDDPLQTDAMPAMRN